MQAEATLRGANANIGAARARSFRRSASPAIWGRRPPRFQGCSRPAHWLGAFCRLITLPIFEGGQLQANLDVATVQKDINVAQYEKTIQTAFREVADGLAARGTYDDEVASLERLTDAEQRALDLSDLRFRNGVDSYLNVLTAQTSLYSAQQTLVAARLARFINLVDLYRSLGGGWLERTGEPPRPAEDVGSIASPSPSPWSLLGTGELGHTINANSQ
jgi:multidrug efflux system outer membrane protein